MGKPSKGTPKDMRLKANKSGNKGSTPPKKSGAAFGGNKAAPFARGGGRKR